MEHNWPGNLRELENVVNRYLVLGDETSILDELKPSESEERFSGAVAAENNGNGNGNGAAGLKALVRNLKGEAESTAIAQVLEGVGMESEGRGKRSADQLQGAAVQDQAVRSVPTGSRLGSRSEKPEAEETYRLVIRYEDHAVRGLAQVKDLGTMDQLLRSDAQSSLDSIRLKL